MSENILIPPGLTRRERYDALLPQVQALVDGEPDWLSRAASVVGALHEGMGFFWTGLYRVAGQELVLGPYQGPVACLRIGYGKGVCGTSWKENRTVVVPDVDAFPGHIACNSRSRSEIVVPLRKDGAVVMVLDIDSVHLRDFDDTDAACIPFFTALIESVL
jgi:L-methionine (R)-S-oxide reductase